MENNSRTGKHRLLVLFMLAVITICMLLPAGCQNPDNSRKSSEVTRLEEIQERGTLKVGTTGDYMLVSCLDPGTGEYVGFDIELANDLADDLDVDIEYVETSWPTLMSDGYFENGKTILCRAEDAYKYTSLESNNRPEVRVMEKPGGTNEKFARENLPDVTLNP